MVVAHSVPDYFDQAIATAENVIGARISESTPSGEVQAVSRMLTMGTSAMAKQWLLMSAQFDASMVDEIFDKSKTKLPMC